MIKFDENIGFTKDVLDPDGRQPSLKYAANNEKIKGVNYAWHPKKGKKEEIQKKMAEIFISEMSNVFKTEPKE